MVVCCRILWFSLLISTLLFSISSADQEFFDTICADTDNRTLCLQVLRDSADAIRAILGETAANAALGQVKVTRDLIYAFAKRAHKPGEKEQYRNCIMSYNFAIESLHKYKTAIAIKDFDTANVRASAALTDAYSCSDEGPDMPPANLPAKLKEANQKDKAYITIPLVVSNVKF
ncbi:pectinesterase inhibitor-like [Apium graveolens]|uniref:pectinesterase inhibitor-like n=1 Tax=Apium graveolens TaxID=4045 RepID=UPI003D7BCCC1